MARYMDEDDSEISSAVVIALPAHPTAQLAFFRSARP